LQVLVSLHDVTPAHLSRLDRAEALLARAGVTRAAYFLVPNYHRKHPVAGDPAFREWCVRERAFETNWVLHGHDHFEDRAVAVAPIGLTARLKRALLTDAEGEFAALPIVQQRERLARGRSAMTDLGLFTSSFVAPAWLFTRDLTSTLASMGFSYTEDHHRVIDVRSGRARSCPVVTWSTRTLARRVGSRVLCPLLPRVWRGMPAIRVALHPFDMDHAATVDSIKRVLDLALADRECAGHADVFT
jgi:hypothetical protein